METTLGIENTVIPVIHGISDEQVDLMMKSEYELIKAFYVHLEYDVITKQRKYYSKIFNKNS